MTTTLLGRSFVRLDRDLLALDIPWALVGGLAVSARTEPRTTRDIDVVVAVSGDAEAEEIVRRLRGRGYIEVEVMDHRHVDRLSTVRFHHREDEVSIFHDVLFATAGIEPEIVAAADLLEVLPGLHTPVATVGHLLALKVLALRPDRPQDRPQDFADIRELLRVSDDDELDRARVAIGLIAERGFDRGKDLQAVLREQLEQFRTAPPLS